jgi:pimeloyl-ACP methyl ester carboxylesterase
MENKLKFVEYGNPKGKTVVYFHGAPGSPDECSIFDKHGKESGLNIICYDRFATELSLQGKDYYKNLADVIKVKVDDDKVDLIGFSIGCHVALETSLYLGDQVRNLHLIAPAAPLDECDFLDDMAGGVVFSLAMSYPAVFTLLSYWQSLLAKVSPNLLFKIVFASAAGQDRELTRSTDFGKYIIPILKSCFNKNLKGYIRDINQYVAPWNLRINKCKVNTTIWQGASDNWSPVSMAKYLADMIPGCKNTEVMEGLSHYSCLFESAPKICQQLADA